MTPAATPEALDQAPSFGIIDPDYARVFTKARCISWAEGYALLMQGSFTRDLDLLAVPWTDRACEPEHLVRRIVSATRMRLATNEPGQKPHGRLAWTLLFKAFGDPRFVDLSVMPRATAEAASLRDEVEAKDRALRDMEEAARPFAACVFNDNGDVTLSTGRLDVHDWLRLDRAQRTALARAATAGEGRSDA